MGGAVGAVISWHARSIRNAAPSFTENAAEEGLPFGFQVTKAVCLRDAETRVFTQ
jgi:hypothetical protein